MKFYAVKVGLKPGIYTRWEACQAQVRGFPGATYQSFYNRQDAKEYLEEEDLDFSSFPEAPRPSTSQRQFSSGSSKKKGKHYAVQCGYEPGIYSTWDECQTQVVGFPGAKFRKFDFRKDAEAYMEGKEFAPKKPGKFKSSGTLTPHKDNGVNIPGLSRSEPEGSEVTEIKGEMVVVYADGCCLSNGRENPRAGYGVFWGEDDPRNVSEPLRGVATNIRAEINAGLHAVQQAKQLGITNLTVRTDSQLLIDSVTKWMDTWKVRGWRLSSGGKPVHNRVDFQRLDEQLDGSIRVNWEYVEAHSGQPGNDMADQLAYEGALRYIPPAFPKARDQQK